MKKYDAIIFDFDGVILESEKIKTDAFKDLFKEHGIQGDIIDVTKGGRSRYEKIKYYYKKLLDIDLTKEELNKIADEYSKKTFDAILNAPFVKDIMEFLKANHTKTDLFVVSGTPTKELKLIMDKRNISSYFKDIYGADDDKNIIINNIVNKYKYNRDKVIYIGDRATDFEEATKAGVRFAGIGRKYKLPEDLVIEFFVELWS